MFFKNTFCEYVTSGCDANTDDWTCCTNNGPCAMGEGDCDNDSECAGNLVCGTDNCRDFDTSWASSTFSCCTTGKKSYNGRKY